jgi:hypothetical protein
MSLTNIKGDVGSGKTLLMAIIAYYSQKPNYANFHLFMDNYNELSPDMLFSLNDGSKVFIDEAYTWIDCRKSAGSDTNIYLSYIVFQSRKKNMDMYLSDQLLETIDLRFRLMPQTIINCIKIGNGFKYVVDHYPRYKRPYILRLSEKQASKFYVLYDTFEIVKPLDKDLMFDMGMSTTDRFDDIDKYVAEICNEYPAKKITKGICEIFCKRKELPKKLSIDIYNSVKAISIKEANNGLTDSIKRDIQKTISSKATKKPLTKKKEV